jgi:hypothetical protein
MQAGRREHSAVCMLGCSKGLSIEFEGPGEPTAVVVRYDDKIHAFPITSEHRLKIGEPRGVQNIETSVEGAARGR